jgi:hypothetical protein
VRRSLTRYRAIWPLLAYTLLTLGMTYPLARHFFTAIPGDGFDGWQNLWNLWWMRQALLVEHRSPYFTDLLYYPTGVSLLFHTLNPFNGLISLPLQLAAGLYVAYNSVVVFSFAVGGLGAFLLARYTLRAAPAPARTWASLLAGAIYTFSPYHNAHLLGHMQLIALEWIPFYALYLCRSLDRAAASPLRARDLVLPALFLVLVALCDWYYFFYCVIFSVLVGLTWLAQRRLTARRVALLAAVGVLCGLALAPLLVPMIAEARRFDFMRPPAEQAYILSADLLAFVTPNEFHPLWGRAVAEAIGSRFASTVSEHTVFVGFTPLLLAIWGARRKEAGRGLWTLAALMFAILALGPALHIAGRQLPIPLPYALLQRLIPFLDISRSISRFDVMVMLALGMLAALGLQALMRSARRPRLIAAGALALTLFEFLPAPYPMAAPDTPPWYQNLAQEPGRFAVLNLPMNWDRPRYLLYQTVHGKPLTAGYISRNDPRTLVERAPVLQALRHLGPDVIAQDLREVGPSVLDFLGVRYVILDAYQMPGDRERLPTEQYASAALAGAAPIYRDERLIVYRVEPPSRPVPFLILGSGWGPRELMGDAPWRAIEGTATLEIHVPQTATLTLQLAARSQADAATLTVRGAALAAEPLTVGATTRSVAVPLGELAPGIHDLTLDANPRIWLSELTLLADDGP